MRRKPKIEHMPPAVEAASPAVENNASPAIHESHVRFIEGKASIKKWKAIKATALLATTIVTGGSVAQLAGCAKNFGKGAVPHEDMQLQVNSSLKEVKLPNKAVLVEGKGQGNASLNVRLKSDLPVVGTVWNHTAAHLTDKNAWATRQGSVVLGTKNNAISLRAIRDGRAKKTGRWAVQASVNADRVYSGTQGMTYVRDSNGEPKVHNGDDFFVRTAGVVIDTGDAKRIANVTDWADASFLSGCGKALQPDLSGGVALHVRNDIRESAGLVQSLPGKSQEASLLRNLARGPIQVVFNHYTEHNGQFRPSTVNPAQLNITPDIPNNDGFARLIGKSPDEVHFTTGANDCVFTGRALQQQMDILNQSRATEAR